MDLDASGQYVIWSVQGKPFEIRLSLDVVDRLAPEVMRGFGAVRRRGTEAGGILLGSIEPAGGRVIVTVKDFELVPCEYAFGPSYMLSGTDLQGLRTSLAQYDPSAGKAVYTVGYFRSHTRDGLQPDGHDGKFFREYFPDPYHVALLIKPFATKASVAGFFVQENGFLPEAPSHLEFPFRRRDLDTRETARPARGAQTRVTASEAPSRTASVEPGEATGAVAVAEAPAQPFPDAMRGLSMYEPADRPWKTRLGWIAFSCMLVMFGTVLGIQYAGFSQSAVVSSAADAYSLSLAAERTDGNILVRWDRQAPAVKHATKGVLTVSESGTTTITSVPMDGAQLQNGAVLYRHVAPEITFKLEVHLRGSHSVVETLTWHADATQGSGRP